MQGTRIKKKITLIISYLVLMLNSPVHSLELDNIAMFGLGFASGTAFHEMGHATAVLTTGGTLEKFNFQSVHYHYSDEISTEEFYKKKRIVTLSGYLFQSLATEAVLQNKNWHQNDYALGWMSLGIVVNLSNPIRYYVFNQTDNDLGSYAAAGGDPLIPALLMVAHASFILYRVFSHTDIPGYLGNNTFALSFKF